jgi:hypothetical protein
LLLVIVLLACVHSAPADSRRRFYGQVIDAKTLKPLGGVEVKFFFESDTLKKLPAALLNPQTRNGPLLVPPAGVTRSDAQGHFAFESRSSGTVT